MLCHLFNQAIALSQQQSDPHMFGSFKGIILKKNKTEKPKDHISCGTDGWSTSAIEINLCKTCCWFHFIAYVVKNKSGMHICHQCCCSSLFSLPGFFHHRKWWIILKTYTQLLCCDDKEWKKNLKPYNMCLNVNLNVTFHYVTSLSRKKSIFLMWSVFSTFVRLSPPCPVAFS